MHFAAARDATAHDRQFFVETDGLLRFLCAEGFARGEQINGFQPVCFALAVVAVDEIESSAPGDFTAQISETVRFKRFEQHVSDFNTCCSNASPNGRGLERPD